jgi:hypothetical protein
VVDVADDKRLTAAVKRLLLLLSEVHGASL